MNQNPQVTIAEYNESYASIKEISDIFYHNYKQVGNINSFEAVRYAMKAKYKHFADLIICGSLVIFFLIPFLLLTKNHSFNPLTTALISITLSLILNYGIFGYYLVHRMNKMHLDHGKELIKRFQDINTRYFDAGGKYWIALLHSSAQEKPKVVGHLGLYKDKPEDLKEKKLGSTLKNGHLEMMGVNSNYRELGIGKKLVQEAIKFAEKEKFDSLSLWVLNINYKAISLYKKYGFHIIDTFELEPLTGLTVFFMIRKII